MTKIELIIHVRLYSGTAPNTGKSETDHLVIHVSVLSMAFEPRPLVSLLCPHE